MSFFDDDFPVAFYFKVSFLTGLHELPFKEVSGLSAEMELETLQEGGSNHIELRVPKQVKHGNLVLKRALAPLSDSLEIWIKSCMEGGLILPIVPDNIIIYLLDADGNPLRGWMCTFAYPIKWSIDSFDAEKNSLMIESIEFAYQDLIRLL